MNARAALLGDPRSRTRTLALAIAIPALATVAFLLEYDAVLTAWPLYAALAVAIYAGWTRAGLLAGWTVVFATILWRFVVPPLVGYVRQSMALRYTPPRVLAYKLDPRGELIEGLTHGPAYALLGAIGLGGAAYLLGAVGRRLVRDHAAVD